MFVLCKWRCRLTKLTYFDKGSNKYCTKTHVFGKFLKCLRCGIQILIKALSELNNGNKILAEQLNFSFLTYFEYALNLSINSTDEETKVFRTRNIKRVQCITSLLVSTASDVKVQMGD